MPVRSKRQSDRNTPRCDIATEIERIVGIDGDAKPGLVHTADIMGPYVGKHPQHAVAGIPRMNPEHGKELPIQNVHNVAIALKTPDLDGLFTCDEMERKAR